MNQIKIMNYLSVYEYLQPEVNFKDHNSCDMS